MPTILKERYILKPAVQSGRLAEICPAHDLVTEKKVAVKLFKCGLATDPVIREAFRRESQRLMHLRHRTIISMLDFGEDGPDGRPYLVLEWGGEPLDQWLHGECPYRDWADFYANLGRPLLEGIAYAHSRETVHRELKPSDFLIDELGQFRLADFGISKFPEFLDQALDVSEFIRANEPYSPVNGYVPDYSYTTDVWGYAVISLHILTKGRLKKWADIAGVLASLSAPEDVRAVLQDALRPEAAERLADAQVLLDRLDAAERKNRRVAPRPRCGLHLTDNAVAKLRQLAPGIETRAQAEVWIGNDINDGPCGLAPVFRLDKETNERSVVPNEYHLMGNTLSLHLAIDDQSQSQFVATSASRPASGSAYDLMRGRAWSCDMEFKLGRIASAESGREAIKLIKSGVAEHEAQSGERQLQHEEERLFRSWNDLLQIRLDHTKEEKAHDYRGVDTDGNRITFKVSGPVDPTILEETWVVVNTFVSGVVDAVGEDTITLYVDEADGREVRESGRLMIDARATQRQLKVQLDALNAMRFPRNDRQEILKRRILHPSDAEIQPGKITIDHWVSPRLDENKRMVIQAALASRDIFLVEGPPGTGKTTFIAELILQFLGRNPTSRVLLTSQTHIAVDNAIERVAEFRPDLRVTRVGRLEAKVAESVQCYMLQNRIQAWRKRVYEESANFLKDRATKEGFKPQEIKMGLDAGLLVRAKQELALAQESEADREKELAEVKRGLAEKDADQNPVADGDRASFLRVECDRIEEDLSRLRKTLKERARILRQLGEIFRKHYPDYAQLVDKTTEEIIEWQDALIGDSPAAQRFRTLFELNAEWVQRFTRDEDCEEAILMDSDLIAGTCIGIAGSDTEGENYGLCILDEASKASLPEALVPLVRSEKWVLVGDQRQLSPFMDAVLRNRQMLADKSIDREIVGETLLARLARLEIPSHAKAMLNRQYRMVPAIGNLISKIFYENKLESAGGQTVPRALTQVWAAPVTWLSTSRDLQRGEQLSNSSWINPLEARWIRILLDRLEFMLKAQGKSASGQGPSLLKVAVLTGYSAQRAHVESVLEGEHRPHLEVECRTVDAYQGREADLVIFCVTRSNKFSRAGFLAERERINVALSRARYALWIVGDADFCRGLGATSPLAEVRDYIEQHAPDCSLKEGIQ